MVQDSPRNPPDLFLYHRLSRFAGSFWSVSVLYLWKEEQVWVFHQGVEEVEEGTQGVNQGPLSSTLLVPSLFERLRK